MCGIVGYIGKREIASVLVDGLKRLEYRGYDSCGVAIMEDQVPKLVRTVGRIGSLEEKLAQSGRSNGGLKYGIGHTRWATHGRPSEDNAHPHRDCTGRFFVAHNGIIENYIALKSRLTQAGHRFITATDTEVLPHLIESYFEGDLERAVRRALRDVEGVFGIVVISTVDSHKIVAARKGAPLVLGLGSGENFVASDVPPLLPYTREVVFLNDGELALIGHDGIQLKDFDGKSTQRRSETITWSAEMAEREGYPHFMFKEIFEQPRAVRDTLRGRLNAAGHVDLGAEFGNTDMFRKARRVHIVACGTSLHAGLVGKFLIERLARLPVVVDYASEFRYREPVIVPGDVVLGISQSGETADTLAAMKEARERGASLVSLCNVVGSQAARLADSVIYTHAGPEIGVASTKAFTTQLAGLYLLALHIARERRTLNDADIRTHAQALQSVPDLIQQSLELNPLSSSLSERLCDRSSFLYLGRGIQYPIAMEGALKLKEVSYIHAEGYTAGEMKHGPIALIDADMPVVVVMPRDGQYEKTYSNVQVVRARDGNIIAVVSEGDEEAKSVADFVLEVPRVHEEVLPLVTVLPLQLLAYHIADLKGTDVDQPRNLAKTVTVE